MEKNPSNGDKDRDNNNTNHNNNNNNNNHNNISNTNSGSNGKPNDKKKIKKYKSENEGFGTIFADEETRSNLFQHLPLIKVKKLKKNPKILNTVSGPYDIHFPLEAFESLICGRSISTYPHIPGRPSRDGDPICDSYCVQMLEDDVMIALVCDGCNWGKRPMEASNIAKTAFVEYLRSHQSEINELRDAGHYLLQALSFCHHKICEGKEDVWEAGTTTLLGGMLFRIKRDKEDNKGKSGKLEVSHSGSSNSNGIANSNSKDDKEDKNFKWVWVCVSIGDCKCFHYDVNQKIVTDLTIGNRKNVYDPKDCGGRLGPYVGNGQPDLGNVMVYYKECEEGDLIMILSDGVHDNLDPQVLGKTPKECGAPPDVVEWTDFKSVLDAQNAKAEFMKKFFTNELILGGEDDDKLRSKVFSQVQSTEPLSPSNITARIMKHCLNVTAKGREWMEQNPREKLPDNYVLYPGKMDHATAVVIRVAKFEKELNKPKSPSPVNRRSASPETSNSSPYNSSTNFTHKR